MIYVVGAGGLGREMISSPAFALNPRVAFLDDDPKLHGHKVIGREVVGPLEEGRYEGIAFIGVGDPKTRASIAERLVQYRLAPHWVLESHATNIKSRVGAGSFFATGSVITVGAIVGEHVAVLNNAVVGHDSVVGECSVICPGAVVSGRCRIGARTLIGANATVLPGVSVGDDAVVGAGAVVTKDVPAGRTVFGNPARSAS